MGFLLTWVPPLRAILLAPFKESLLADANLEGFDPRTYFEDSPVRLKSSGQTKGITSAISGNRRGNVLEGESGLGKTMFLRHLAQRSKRTLAYLPATKCPSRGLGGHPGEAPRLCEELDLSPQPNLQRRHRCVHRRPQ